MVVRPTSKYLMLHVGRGLPTSSTKQTVLSKVDLLEEFLLEAWNRLLDVSICLALDMLSAPDNTPN